MKTKGWVGLSGSILLVCLVAALGFRMWVVHEQTWDWRLWPREVPEKVHFAGRDFNSGDDAKPYEPQDEDIVTGMSAQGKTAGGAEILSLAPGAGIYIGVKATDGTYICSLMGGL